MWTLDSPLVSKGSNELEKSAQCQATLGATGLYASYRMDSFPYGSYRYHGCKDPRLPENFKCFECRLRATQASVILAESSIKQYLVKYADLALFRYIVTVLLLVSSAYY